MRWRGAWSVSANGSTFIALCARLWMRPIAGPSCGRWFYVGPEDQGYGDRTGVVRDAFGNQWYIATPGQ